MSWKKAEQRGGGHKVLMWGPPGCWKTRLMLRLGHVAEGEPKLAVLDSERGTDHYGKEFNFAREFETEFAAAQEKIEELITKPGLIVSLGIDSYTVLDKSLIDKWVQAYLKRLPTSSGHHREFYVLQPSDHQNINRERDKLIRKFWASDLNIFMILEVKSQWEGLKIVGTTFDAPDRFRHFFDTVIEITERGRDLIGYRAKVHKDRTYILRANEIYDWDTEEQAYELMKGFDLTNSHMESKPAGTGGTQEKSATESPSPSEKKKKETPPPSPSQEDKPEDKKALLHKVAALKKELRIVDKAKWDKLLVPYNVTTATKLTNDQINKFITELEVMRPTDAQAG